MDKLIEQIKRQITHHEEIEKSRASVNDYNQALYHNHRRGALEDLLIWVKLNELSVNENKITECDHEFTENTSPNIYKEKQCVKCGFSLNAHKQ